MLGIGHRLDKATKQKILGERAKDFNTKYDNLTSTGINPDDAVKTLNSEDFQKRHQCQPEPEPYNVSKNINALGGTVNQGYFEAHKVISTTKTMFVPMKEQMEKSKQTKPDLEVLQQAKNDFQRMKVRIYKDHLQEDAEIDLGQKKQSDYKRHFVEDDKMKHEVHRDKRYNQWQNDLKDYAQHYLRSKQVLRKC